MDVIKLIKDDHRKVEELFAEFEKLGDLVPWFDGL